ncbi:protein NO VEIN-like [Argonauta hians]
MENAKDMKQKRMWLNQEMVNLLKEHPHGIEKGHFWDTLNQCVKGIGSKVKYGVKNMNDLLETYPNIEVLTENNVQIVKLKTDMAPNAGILHSMENLKQVLCKTLEKNNNRIKRGVLWKKLDEALGCPLTPSQYGFSNFNELLKNLCDVIVEIKLGNETYIIKKTTNVRGESSSHSESNILLGEGPSLAEVRHKFCEILSHFPQGMPLRDLIGNYNKKYPRTQFILSDFNVDTFADLFKLPELRCFNILIQNNLTMIYFKENSMPMAMPPMQWGAPAFGNLQQPQQSVTDSFHLKSFSELPPLKTNAKEISVPPLNFAPGEKLSQERLDEIANECIDILSEHNECVTLKAIENLFLKRLRSRNIRDIGLRSLDHLPSIREHNRLACKVNIYIQAFVLVRSLCTLKEVEECVSIYICENNSFKSLRLGPFHKMQVVFDLFKFPPTEDSYPPLTSMDILTNIRNFLDKNNWHKKHEVTEVIDFITNAYNCPDPFRLGIRLRSLPLAIGVIKRAQRDDSMLTRRVFDEMKMKLTEDIREAFDKFRNYMLVTKQNDTVLRDHYAKMSADSALKEIFERLCLLLNIEEPKTTSEKRKKQKFIESVNNFFQQINSSTLARTVFHVAICVSSTELEATAMEFLEQSSPSALDEADNVEIPPPQKEMVLQSVKKYLEKYIGSGSLTLNHFNKIEERLLEDFNMTTFSQMGYGRFLSFIHDNTSIKKILNEAGITISSAATDANKSGTGVYKPLLLDVCSFVNQCKTSGSTQNAIIEKSLCHHYRVKTLKSIGHGSVQHLVDLTEKTPHPPQNVFYEAALCCQERSMDILDKVGILGHQTQQVALATLHNCPLLEDMSSWSHWSLVFEPQFGSLPHFVRKYGGGYYKELDGGRKSIHIDFMILETEPGKYLKIVSETSVEKFTEACHRSDVVNLCGHLVSLIVLHKGLAMAPYAYLSNILKTQLFTLNDDCSKDQDNGKYIGKPARFVLDCLLRLPIKICVAIANKMFLDPLGAILGSTESKHVLWQMCENIQETNYLETLACLLGIAEWNGHLKEVKGVFRASEVVTIAEMDDDQPILIETEEEEEEDEEEAESEDVSNSSDEDDASVSADNSEVSTLKPSDVITIDEEEKDGDSDNADGKHSETLQKEPKEGETEGEREEEGNEKETISSEKALIENIRCKEFGMGIELTADGQRLIDQQQKLIGRSLDRLSKDLYSKDSHFVLELIQNADDNSYPDKCSSSKTPAFCPAVHFTIDNNCVTILNNEVGFNEKNIRAICDVGNSTKEKRKFGYIGQKGIGFKSVFRITDRPEIHSNNYHFYFDVNSGPIGYILPHWIDSPPEPQDNWATKIILPLKDGVQQSKTLAASFNDIHHSLLLFLHRLKKITLKNQVQGKQTVMERQDRGHDIVEITHNGVVDRWFVVKKLLDATKMSAQVKCNIDVASTEIALAFPMKFKDSIDTQVLPEKQPVFAFLPLRSYGLRFIIQGDFDLPSNRESVDSDSLWNQWLNSEIPHLFLESLEKFKTHETFSSPVMAIAAYLRFVPEEDEVLDFFKPVATHIQKMLKSKPCIPCLPITEGGPIQWKIPSQTLLGQDLLTMKVAPPEKLREILNLYYIHPDLACMLNTSITSSLGIEKIKVTDLLKIGEGLASGFSDKETVSEDEVTQIAQWFACVYRSLDEMANNEEVLTKLSEIRLIPLSTSALTTLTAASVFRPMSSEKTPLNKQTDKFDPLWNDLRTLHSGLFNTDDQEINSQVHKVLFQAGVQPLLADKIISHHILPILQSDQWKSKSEATLVSYVQFMKYQYDKSPNSFVFSELSCVVPLKTSRGMLCPDQAAIHFSPAYGNFNLVKELPGYDWIILDDVYLKGVTQTSAKLAWHEFFSRLNVNDFLSITEHTVTINKDSKEECVWQPLYATWPACSGDYVIVDKKCDQFESLVSHNRDTKSYSKQMDVLCRKIDELWDKEYFKYTMTTVKSSEGHILKEIPTSFAINLQTLPWVPAEEKTLENNDGTVQVKKKFSEQVPNQLYLNSDDLKLLLDHSVPYLRFKMSSEAFCQFLSIKTSVNPSYISDLLISWGKQVGSDKTELCRSLRHMTAIYKYLGKNLTNDEFNKIFHDERVIFVPNTNDRFNDYTVGKMYDRKEVWWVDETDLINKHSDLLKKYKKKCSLKSGIGHFYSDLEECFVKRVVIPKFPNLEDYAELIQVLSYLGDDGLRDMLELFALIGEKIMLYRMSKSQDLIMLCRKEIYRILEILQDENIFPTTTHKLVGLSDHPVIVDSRIYEEMFKDHIPFINLDHQTINKKKVKIPADKRKHLRCFYDLFGIKLLSDSIKTETRTEVFEPCYSLHKYMHQIIFPIQSFLCNNYPDIYEQWSQLNFHDSVNKWMFSQVRDLEVWYTFVPNPDIYLVQGEMCLIEENMFYVKKDFVDLKTLNIHIAQFFSLNNKMCNLELKDHLNMIHEKLNKPEEFEKFMEKLPPIPCEEEKWIIKEPPPTAPQPVYTPDIIMPQQFPLIDLESTAAPAAAAADNQPTGLVSWPPKSSAIMTNNMEAKNNSHGNNVPKSWPLPEAPPGYYSAAKEKREYRITETSTDKVPATGQTEQPAQNRENPAQNRENPGKSDTATSSAQQRLTTPHDSTGEARVHCESSAYRNASDATHHGGSHPSVANGPRGPNVTDSSQVEGSDTTSQKSLHRRKRSIEDTDEPRAKRYPHPSFDFPTWLEGCKDLEYKELACGSELTIPDEYTIDPESNDCNHMTARWGEHLVFNYLLKQKTLANSFIYSISWMNEIQETGQPYDIKVGLKKTDDDGVDSYHEEFIEVKSTVSDKKSIFEISSKELEFANQKLDNYHVYRVFNAGNSNTVRLLKIENLAQNLKLKKITLCLVV